MSVYAVWTWMNLSTPDARPNTHARRPKRTPISSLLFLFMRQTIDFIFFFYVDVDESVIIFLCNAFNLCYVWRIFLACQKTCSSPSPLVDDDETTTTTLASGTFICHGANLSPPFPLCAQHWTLYTYLHHQHGWIYSHMRHQFARKSSAPDLRSTEKHILND